MERRLSILLAEDDDAHRDTLMQILSAEGWIVHAASSGVEAINVARSKNIDFSILDLHMPGLSGIETILVIRQEVRPVPCILMSGQASKEEQVQAFAAGAFSFLQKPIPAGLLRDAVSRLIHRHFTGR
jgi:CheY-like chemotaxis protein